MGVDCARELCPICPVIHGSFQQRVFRAIRKVSRRYYRQYRCTLSNHETRDPLAAA
jgi:hypothetical protein